MEGFYDDKENVQVDIQIGRNELKKLQFDYTYDDKHELVYELYCIPSHNEQAYYVQIFKKNATYYASYVKFVNETDSITDVKIRKKLGVLNHFVEKEIIGQEV